MRLERRRSSVGFLYKILLALHKKKDIVNKLIFIASVYKCSNFSRSAHGLNRLNDPKGLVNV